MGNTEIKPSVRILIPAYNESGAILDVIGNLRTAGYGNILVVNDGSTDDTGKRAGEAGAEVLSLVINRGQGAAIRTGMEYLRETGTADIVVTFDADGQHRAEDIGNLIRPILEDQADVVLGSRFLGKKDIPIPRMRKLVLRAGILFTNLVSEVRLTDTHNGLRAFNRTALEKIRIMHRGMEHASDIIDQISVNGLRYAEVPVTVLYTDYSMMKGQRTGNFVKMGIRIILEKYFS